MKDLIIVGAGGFGRELFYIITESIGYNVDFKIAGYIDDDLTALDRFPGYPPVIGKISTHAVSENQVFICSIAKTSIKLKVISDLLDRGASFITIVHKTARVVNSSFLGKGCIVGPIVSIGANSYISDYCILQTGSIIGHDVSIGINSRVDNYAILVAGVKVDANCTIHSNSVINANVHIAESATVGACSFVIKNVKAHSSVFGNPAKQLF